MIEFLIINRNIYFLFILIICLFISCLHTGIKEIPAQQSNKNIIKSPLVKERTFEFVKDSARKASTKNSFDAKILSLDTNAYYYQLVKCPFDTNWIFVKFVYELHWSEDMKILKVVQDKILTEIENPNLGNSFDTAYFIKQKSFSSPIIAIECTTHRGNGGINLYAIENDTLRELLDSKTASDGDGDGNTIFDFIYRNFRLSTNYTDINNDGYTDIKISGYVDAHTIHGDSSFFQQKIYLWNYKQQKFVKAAKYWKGFLKGREADE